jgi:hypothetical protein
MVSSSQSVCSSLIVDRWMSCKARRANDMLDDTVKSVGSGSRGMKLNRGEYFPKSLSSVLPQLAIESRHRFRYNETSVGLEKFRHV